MVVLRTGKHSDPSGQASRDTTGSSGKGRHLDLPLEHDEPRRPQGFEILEGIVRHGDESAEKPSAITPKRAPGTAICAESRVADWIARMGDSP